MRRLALKSAGALVALALLVSCGEDSGDEDLQAPGTPVMRLKACSPEGPVWPESGVDAEPGSSGIRIEWQLDPRPEDLAGFVVYRGHRENADSLGAFLEISGDPGQFLVGAPEYFSFIDSGQNLVLFTSPDIHGNLHEWHYFVRSLDTAGNLSAPSDTVHYTLYDAPRIQAASISADSLFVRWSYAHPGARLAGYHLLLVEEGAGLVWSSSILQDFDLLDFNRQYSLAGLGALPGRQFRLRVDTLYEPPASSANVISNPDLCPLAGSESGWIVLQP